jgi:hypothetical protein
MKHPAAAPDCSESHVLTPSFPTPLVTLVKLSPVVIEEFKRIIAESEITKEDDGSWPEPDKIGRQELEIRMDKEHISFTVSLMLHALPVYLYISLSVDQSTLLSLCITRIAACRIYQYTSSEAWCTKRVPVICHMSYVLSSVISFVFSHLTPHTSHLPSGISGLQDRVSAQRAGEQRP